MDSALFPPSCGSDNTMLPSRNTPESRNTDLRLFQLRQVVFSDTVISSYSSKVLKNYGKSEGGKLQIENLNLEIIPPRSVAALADTEKCTFYYFS